MTQYSHTGSATQLAKGQTSILQDHVKSTYPARYIEYFDGNNALTQSFTLSIFPNNVLAVSYFDTNSNHYLPLREVDSTSNAPTDSFFISGRILRFATDSSGYYKPPTHTNSIRVEYDAIGSQLVGTGGQPVTVRQDAAGDYRLYVDIESDVTLSVDTASTVNVNVKQWGASSTSLGQKVMTASVPVVLASDHSSVNVSASQIGTYSIRQVETITTSLSGQPIQIHGSAITVSHGTNVTASPASTYTVSWTNFPTVSAQQTGTYSVRQVETITVSAPAQTITTGSLASGSDVTADATSSVFTFSTQRSGIFYLDWDENGGVAPTLDVTIQARDDVTNKFVNFAAFGQKASGAATAWGTIGPGHADNAQSDFGAGHQLPKVVRVIADLGGTNPTYSYTVSFEAKD